MLKKSFHTLLRCFGNSDIILSLLMLTASVYGILLIASLQREGGADFLKTQIIALCLGIAASLILSKTDHRIAGKLWWLLAGIALALTIAVFFVGIQVSGTDDVGWIKIGAMTFQPSELTKICFMITFSKHLDFLDAAKRLKSFFGVMTLLIHTLVPVVLIHLQGDDGAALVFALMSLTMAFAAGVQLRYFLVTGAAAAVSVPVLWFGVLNTDQKNRLLAAFGADGGMSDSYGWQQYQGRISVSSGGVFGKGLFKGPRVASQVVPYQENDFIFTVSGEELGFIGCIAVIVLLALILFRVLHIACRAGDIFSRSICIGYFALVASQTLINVGMVLGLMPVVGVTLPFFSSGGTSLVCMFTGAGLVQSVYADTRKIK